MNPRKGVIRIVDHGSKAYDLSVELRDRILRKPLGLQFSKADLAKESDDLHIAYMIHADVFGCMVLSKTDKHSIKMRQVAVDEDFQGQGIGTKMLHFAEKHAKKLGFTSIYCHARDVATPFYLKHGYSIDGDPFEEVTIRHYRMVKFL